MKPMINQSPIKSMMKPLFCSMAWCLWSAGIHATEAADVRLLRQIQAVHQFQADFVQKSISPHKVKKEDSHGIFQFARPGRFRWEVRPPRHEILIADGEKLWHYEPELEQVSVRQFNPDQDATPAALLSGRAETWVEKYRVIDLPKTQSGQGFRLLPKDSEQNIKDIELRFKGDLLSGLIIHDTVGQEVNIQFFKVQQNKPIPGTRFQFKPPPGVDVVAAS